MPVEREVKWTLKPADEARARRAFAEVACVRQVTLYFDTDDLRLARAGCMLRLRREGGAASACLKSLRSVSAGGGVEADEYEVPLSQAVARAAAAAPRRLPAHLPAAAADLVERARREAPLGLVGRLRNTRRTLVLAPSGLAGAPPAAALPFLLDRLRLPDGRLHVGIELESSAAEDRERLDRALAAAGVLARPDPHSKYEMLLGALGRTVARAGAGPATDGATAAARRP